MAIPGPRSAAPASIRKLAYYCVDKAVGNHGVYGVAWKAGLVPKWQLLCYEETSFSSGCTAI